MKKMIRPFLCLSLLMGLAFVVASTAFAGSVTVTNDSSSSTAYVRTKTADGQYDLVMVQPGQSATIADNVERVRINSGDPNGVKLTDADGNTSTVGDRAGQSLIVRNPGPQVVVRTEGGTAVLPRQTTTEVNNSISGGDRNVQLENPVSENMNLGTGSPPAASDGPTNYVGTPMGNIKLPASPGEPGSPTFNRDWGLGEDDRRELANMGYRTDQQVANFLDSPGGFFWYMSGSGGMFGDGTGVNFNPFFMPGYPRFGAPVGSWVHNDIENSLFVNDSNLETALQAGDFAQFSNLFEANFGEFREDVRAAG